MDIMRFKDLAQLARTGNFSQAAELNNLSQPAFSRRIKSLETWVGVTLVDRTRQPVRLTEAGTQILEAGLQAITRIETERSQILDARALPDRYVITFGAQHSIGWRFFPAWLQALEVAFGPFLSRLRADDLPNCLRDLRAGDIDFVIAYFSPGSAHDQTASDPDLEAVTIGSDQLVPVCRPDSTGKPIFELGRNAATAPLLRFGDKAPLGKLLDPLWRRHDLARRFTTVYENSMAGALRIRARDGGGIAWLPESLVAPDLAAGFLVPAGRPEWRVALEIRLLRIPGQGDRATRALWGFLYERQRAALLTEGWTQTTMPSPPSGGLR